MAGACAELKPPTTGVAGAQAIDAEDKVGWRVLPDNRTAPNNFHASKLIDIFRS